MINLVMSLLTKMEMSGTSGGCGGEEGASGGFRVGVCLSIRHRA